MDIKSIAIAAILGAAGGFGGSYYVMSEQTASIHQRLNQTRQWSWLTSLKWRRRIPLVPLRRKLKG